MSGAEIAVHPNDRFVYVSNRGANSIAVFAIDRGATEKEVGTLKAAGTFPSGGKTPRNFAIDPTGTYLIAANQDGDSLVVFRINQQTGNLEPTGIRVDVPRPVCVRFVAAAD